MSTGKGFLGTVPRKSLAIFLLGVFFLFTIFGLASDMSDMGRQPALRFVLSCLVISTFALGYALAGFTMRGKGWKVMVPLFIVQLFVMGALRRWLPDLPRVGELDAAATARLQTRLTWEMFAIMGATFVGYGCFVYASVTEGRRYFRAHAEIALAQEIHEVLVPTIDTKMGGDLIDLAGTDEKWVAYLADVSGHGVAPGLVMGMAKSASRMLLSSGDDSEHLMPRLNEVLYPLKKADMFITFCFVAMSGGQLRAGLAGHPPILRFSAGTGEVTELECPNMPLGILPSGEFATTEITTDAGTLFALYTDGFLEATNVDGEEFGVARLKGELQKHGKEPLEAICKSIKESVAKHGAQFDDQSMLLIRRL
jgi:hypothetical protein